MEITLEEKVKKCTGNIHCGWRDLRSQRGLFFKKVRNKTNYVLITDSTITNVRIK